MYSWLNLKKRQNFENPFNFLGKNFSFNEKFKIFALRKKKFSLKTHLQICQLGSRSPSIPLSLNHVSRKILNKAWTHLYRCQIAFKLSFNLASYSLVTTSSQDYYFLLLLVLKANKEIFTNYCLKCHLELICKQQQQRQSKKINK